MAKRIASAAAVLFLTPSVASAQLVISEVMYDLAEGSDSGREWIEVYNESGVAVDLTEWKFFEGNTNHGIVETSDTELPPGSYAIIADNPTKFKTDWPLFSGLLFDSAFSLNNTGETLGLRCCGKELTDKDPISYSNTLGGAGDGASLSRSGSTFVPTDPTPGSAPGSARTTPEPEKTPPTTQIQKLPEPAPKPQEQKTSQQETQKSQSNETFSQSNSEATASVAKDEMPRENTGTPLPAATKKKSISKPEPAEEEKGSIVSEETAEETVDNNMNAQTAASASADGAKTPWLWWGGALGIAFFGAGGAYLMGRRRGREWKIIEETGEDV